MKNAAVSDIAIVTLAVGHRACHRIVQPSPPSCLHDVLLRQKEGRQEEAPEGLEESGEQIQTGQLLLCKQVHAYVVRAIPAIAISAMLGSHAHAHPPPIFHPPPGEKISWYPTLPASKTPGNPPPHPDDVEVQTPPHKSAASGDTAYDDVDSPVLVKKNKKKGKKGKAGDPPLPAGWKKTASKSRPGHFSYARQSFAEHLIATKAPCCTQLRPGCSLPLSAPRSRDRSICIRAKKSRGSRRCRPPRRRGTRPRTRTTPRRARRPQRDGRARPRRRERRRPSRTSRSTTRRGPRSAKAARTATTAATTR